MLAREHEADLEREAEKRHLAAELGRPSSAPRLVDRALKAVLRWFAAITRTTGRVKLKDGEPCAAAVAAESGLQASGHLQSGDLEALRLAELRSTIRRRSSSRYSGRSARRCATL
jgi:hypothetical protein